MENLTNSIDPKVEYLFSASRNILVTNYWEVMSILSNLSEDHFGSVHYNLNEKYPGLINYYIEQAKMHLYLTSDINSISSKNTSDISQLYLARLYYLKKNDLLKHYIEIEYTEKLQCAIADFILQLCVLNNKILATYSEQIIIILSRVSFINFCRAMQILDSKPGLSIHYVMEVAQYCYSYNPNDFNTDKIDFIYANEILKRRLILLKENNDLDKLFAGSIRTRLVNEFLQDRSEIDEDDIENYKAYCKEKIFNEIKTEEFLRLHIESELEVFMSFVSRNIDLIENIDTLLCDMNEENNE